MHLLGHALITHLVLQRCSTCKQFCRITEIQGPVVRRSDSISSFLKQPVHLSDSDKILVFYS